MSSDIEHHVDNEKGPGFIEASSDDAVRYSQGLGELRVLRASGSDNVKLAKDGVTVLIPQPSDDPDDVLNWSTAKKYKVLLSLVFASLLTDFGMTWGTVRRQVIMHSTQATDI